MDEILRNPSEEQIIYAIEQNFYDFLGKEDKIIENPPYKSIEFDSFTLIDSGIPHAMTNWIIATNMSLKETEDKINKVIEYFSNRNLPFFWVTGPCTKPENLADILVTEYDFVAPTAQPGMAYDLNQLEEKSKLIENLELVKVTSYDEFQLWGDILVKSFGMNVELLKDYFIRVISQKNEDKQSVFLGYYDGKAVGTALVYYETGVAGIYCIGTLEDTRGKGIGTAMTYETMHDAKEKGYEVAILHASEMGFSVYKRLGFKEYCKIQWLQWSPKKKE